MIFLIYEIIFFIRLSNSTELILIQNTPELIFSFDSVNISSSNYYQLLLTLISPSTTDTLFTANPGSPPIAASITEQ